MELIVHYLPHGDHHIGKIGGGNFPILMGSARLFWKRDSQLLAKGLGEKDLLAMSEMSASKIIKTEDVKL
jgi:hypothetical protein